MNEAVLAVNERQVFEVTVKDIFDGARFSRYTGPISMAARRHFGPEYQIATTLAHEFAGARILPNSPLTALLQVVHKGKLSDPNLEDLDQWAFRGRLRGSNVDGYANLVDLIRKYQMSPLYGDEIEHMSDQEIADLFHLPVEVELEMVWRRVRGVTEFRGPFLYGLEPAI